jgi:ATP-dependent DNA helicase RecG
MGRVDELGSGILNVYKYMKFYSPGKTAQFIEDDLFKTIIPLDDIYIQRDDAVKGKNDTLNETLNETLSQNVKERVVKILNLIRQNNGLTIKEMLPIYNIKRATAHRDVKILREAGLIEFIGPDKTGKYKLTAMTLQLFAG